MKTFFVQPIKNGKIRNSMVIEISCFAELCRFIKEEFLADSFFYAEMKFFDVMRFAGGIKPVVTDIKNLN